MRSYLNETKTMEETGYRFIDVKDPQPAQVDEMMMMCRKSCAKLYKEGVNILPKLSKSCCDLPKSPSFWPRLKNIDP